DMELVTEDGTLLKGMVETDRPEEVRRMLMEEFDVPADLIAEEAVRGQLEVAPWVLRELAAQLPWNCYQVEVYPTADHLEVEREPLNRIKVKRNN
ncbi:MAG TPA: radical SAM protein, partial [Methanomassiliicoccales archaeon]|nr:radical SAM protein [Methanomassiliicoccales archaeon]